MNSTETLPTAGRAQDVTADLTDSARYRLLADDCRRRALDALAKADDRMRLEDLASAMDGPGPDADARSSDDGLEIALHHRHLPMLDDAGLVEYDPATRTIEPGAAL